MVKIKTMDENIQMRHIVVDARVTKSVIDCIKDSIDLSLKMDTDVILYHNDNEYRIVMDDIVNAMTKVYENRNSLG